jgi:hypothetical protein
MTLVQALIVSRESLDCTQSSLGPAAAGSKAATARSAATARRDRFDMFMAGPDAMEILQQLK